METNEKNYPTAPDANGFYFEDSMDEAREISTKRYDNGNLIKSVRLRQGKIAIVRELDRKELLKMYEIAGDGGNDNTRVIAAMISLATKIDDKEIIMEDVLEYKAKDFARLSTAAQSLNF